MSTSVSPPAEDASLAYLTNGTDASRLHSIAQARSTGINITESESIPLREKIGFSLGANVDLICGSLLTGLFMQIFNICLGMIPADIGTVLMIMMAWNAMLDPIAGYVTDNVRTRWGRRRPYMIFGAIGCAAIYPVFWFMPPTLPEQGRFFYLLLAGLGYYTCYSFWAMSYYGLQLELTPNYHERTRLTAWMTAFYKIASLGAGWNGALIASAWFATADGSPDIVAGMRHVCWPYTLFLLLFGVAPALLVKEREFGFVPRKGAAGPDREPFWKNIRESVSNRPLWILISISFLLVVGTASVGAVGTYVGIYYLFDGDLAKAGMIAGWKGTVITVSGLLLIPFWTWLGRFYDKRTLVIATLSLTIVGHLIGYFLYTRSNPWLSIIPGFFESGAMSAIWLFLPSMKGDVADYDEQLTGRRREGSINSFYSWFFKAALTLSAGLGGWVAKSTGFDVNLNAHDAIFQQRVFMVYLFLPLFFWIAALALAFTYPLTRDRVAAIRAENEARRGTVKTAA